MASSPSLLSSILNCKCPKCRKGDLFAEKVFQRPLKFSKMHASCEVCHQSFEPEPGFYFGAMFISYALNTALLIATWVAMELVLEKYSIWLLLSILGGSMLIFLPAIFRISRSIWIAIFVSYRSDLAKNDG